MTNLGPSELEEMVRLTGQALEREDHYIAECFAKNNAYSAQAYGWHPGILHLDDEKYYQRMTARALLASFPLRVKLEEQAQPGNSQHFDLVLYSADAGKRLAVGEVKRCMEAGDVEKDARGVRSDVEKLRSMAPAECGRFMLLFTHNPSEPQGATDKWWAEFRKQVPLPSNLQMKRYGFPTRAHWRNGPSVDEFSVIGFTLE